MPERLRRLQTTLDDLDYELRALESLDEQTRCMLQDAAREIQSALDMQDPERLAPHLLAERLKNTAAEFESSHPNLSAVIGKMIDLLGQMRI
jgi:hypothetical protein